MIHEVPTDLGGRNDVDADERGRLGTDAEGLSRLSFAARPQGRGRPAVSGGDPFLCRRECALAGAAGALRPLEHGMEALRPAEQGRGVRGLFRHACIHEYLGAADPNVR